MSEQPALSADVTAAWVPIEDLLKAERERDEALAALARVRALLTDWERYDQMGPWGLVVRPLRAALEGP